MTPAPATPEEMAMALKIASSFGLPLFSKEKKTAFDAALAAIIETRDRDAALVESFTPLADSALERIAAAMRSGQQFRKDV